MKRPHPQAVVGVPGMGPLVGRAGSKSASSLCGGGRRVSVLCFSHITFRLISLSRTDPVPGLVRLRQRFVRWGQWLQRLQGINSGHQTSPTTKPATTNAIRKMHVSMIQPAVWSSGSVGVSTMSP